MNFSTLFRIACDPPARVWSGHGDLDVPADDVEIEGARYIGGGDLVNLPDLEQFINGDSVQVDVTLSGVSPEAVRLATEEAESVKGAACHFGFVWFDDAWQVVEVEWLAIFNADYLTTGRQGTVRTITLSLSDDNADRSRAPIAFWTDADQRHKSPTDRFFDHVAGITTGTSRRFGPSE